MGTFSSAAGGRLSEKQGVAAVEILHGSSYKFRAPQQDITGLPRFKKIITSLLNIY